MHGSSTAKKYGFCSTNALAFCSTFVIFIWVPIKIVAFAFLMFHALFFFNWGACEHRPAKGSCALCTGSTTSWVLCTVHGIHYLLSRPNTELKFVTQVGPVHYSRHGTHKPFFSATSSLKIDLTALFTYLKIILLQYF